MERKSAFNSLKGIIAMALISAIHINASGQAETAKAGFDIKERFISSGGLFFAEPSVSAKGNNYSGLSFSPQLNLLNSFSDFSIAFGSQLDLGYKLSSSDSNSKFMASIPAMITANLGHLASKDFYSSFGLFAGGGYDFCFLEGKMQKGIMWSAGLRTWFFKKSFTLRYSQLALDNSNITMRVFSLQLNLGSYLEKVYKNNQISRFIKPMRR